MTTGHIVEILRRQDDGEYRYVPADDTEPTSFNAAAEADGYVVERTGKTYRVAAA